VHLRSPREEGDRPEQLLVQCTADSVVQPRALCSFSRTIGHVERVRQDSSAVPIRPLAPSDCLAGLTQLLHRAYAPLATRGMRYLASHQDEAMTRSRVNEGECYVAVDRSGDIIIATVTLVPPGVPDTEGCAYYQKPGVARFGQFAVEPSHQGRGIGSLMMDHIEARAAELGATFLALDTSEHAHDLIAMYIKRGYIVVQRVQWGVTNYQSIVMAKQLAGAG